MLRITVFFFLLCCTVDLLRGQQESSNEQLVSELVREACMAENYTDFYLSIREKENKTRRFPAWPNADTNLPGVVILWSREDSYEIIPAYETFFQDLFLANTPQQSTDYQWCVYLLSTTHDVHGCVSNNTKWGSPLFEQLGLLDKLSTRDVGPEWGLDRALDSLVVERIDQNMYIEGNELWHNAFITLNINWTGSPHLSSAGEYLIMESNIEDTTPVIFDITSQNDAFLIKGEEKRFECRIYGFFGATINGWSRGENEALTSVLLQDCDPEEERSCDSVHYRQFLLTTTNCMILGTSSVPSLLTNLLTLVFEDPAENDTGVYNCFVHDPNTDEVINVKHIYVHVVFIEAPAPNTALLLNKLAELKWTVKAPTNSNFTVWHNGGKIEAGPRSESSCNHIPHMAISAEAIDENFSLYTVRLEICDVGISNIGSYECRVNYTIPDSTEPVSASLTRFIIAKQDGPLSDSGSNESLTIGLSISLTALILAVIFIVITVLMIQRCRRRALDRSMMSKMAAFTIAAKNDLYPTFSTDSLTTDKLEFARKNLHMHEEIGKGRFGKVMRATAYGIVPEFPSINKVAVKMTTLNTAHNHEILAAELAIMKEIHPHNNICNLLACCTVDGPFCIIMEFACHGNLKDYLDSCRKAVLLENKPLCITSKANEAETPGNARDITPGALHDVHVFDFAFQIGSGLEHLEEMGIVHCDLAARNILICEGFILKISDFGLSKKAPEENDDYINSNMAAIDDFDDVLAVKWAAVETLESREFSYKSDMWSCAVIIWEIASYGAKPFSDIKLGVSLNQFIQHIRNGNRLSKPDGMSDSVYQLLLRCWSVEPSYRPSALTFKQFFQNADVF